MFCAQCGNEVDPTSNTFCPFCGTKLEQNPQVAAAPAAAAAPSSYTPQAASNFSQIFIDPEESYVTSLGRSGHIMDLFMTNGKMVGWAAILSDQRLYLKGNVTELEFGKLQKLNVQKTIDLEDVTGSGFAYTNPNVFTLIFSILHFLAGFWFFAQSSGRGGLFYRSDLSFVPILLIIFGIIWLIVYLTSRHTLFFVEYAGGNIKFDATAIGLRESQIFEKNIRIAKNLLKKKREMR